MKDLEAFARLIDAIGPWRSQLVIVGGWAHRLHRFDPRANVPHYEAVRTLDADVAFGDEVRLEGDIRSALIDAGFSEELSSDHRPPVSHYALGGDDQGFYAEFLTPLRGSGVKRSGVVDATMATAGITAQKLRHLEILLVEPWQIQLSGELGIPVAKAVTIRVANPVSFIVQKLLIQHLRTPDKRAQDVLYIHDTLELFGATLDDLQRLWDNVVRPTLSPARQHEVVDLARSSFAAVTNVLRDAARIPQDRTLVPERMLALLQHGLHAILTSAHAE